MTPRGSSMRYRTRPGSTCRAARTVGAGSTTARLMVTCGDSSCTGARTRFILSDNPPSHPASAPRSLEVRLGSWSASADPDREPKRERRDPDAGDSRGCADADRIGEQRGRGRERPNAAIWPSPRGRRMNPSDRLSSVTNANISDFRQRMLVAWPLDCADNYPSLAAQPASA